MGSNVGDCAVDSVTFQHFPKREFTSLTPTSQLLPISSPCQECPTHIPQSIGQKLLLFEANSSLRHIYKCIYIPNTHVQMQMSMHTYSHTLDLKGITDVFSCGLSSNILHTNRATQTHTHTPQTTYQCQSSPLKIIRHVISNKKNSFHLFFSVSSCGNLLCQA